MAEYIKREDALSRFTYEGGDRISEVDVDNFPATVTIKDVKRVLREIPAADVIPVAHGHWIEHPTGGLVCSHCDRYKPDEWRSMCCPNCGAILDGQVECDG